MARHQARKRFGQNFLIDTSIIEQIANLFVSTPDTPHGLIEIGPGRGALTEALLKRQSELTAIELDRDLIPILQTKFASHAGFTLINEDALRVDYKALGNGKPQRLVGNLPYNVATPLIFKLLEDVDKIVDMHFMLQWEVLARICAKPSEPNYGQLSLIVQNLCETKALFNVPPSAFSPAPKVESGFIALTPRTVPIIDKSHQETFTALVKASFAQRRKTLRNNLKGILDNAQIVEAGVDPGCRAETLGIDSYKAMTEILTRDE